MGVPGILIPLTSNLGSGVRAPSGAPLTLQGELVRTKRPTAFRIFQSGRGSESKSIDLGQDWVIWAAVSHSTGNDMRHITFYIFITVTCAALPHSPSHLRIPIVLRAARWRWRFAIIVIDLLRASAPLFRTLRALSISPTCLRLPLFPWRSSSNQTTSDECQII
jgi:hypothetical protein